MWQRLIGCTALVTSVAVVLISGRADGSKASGCRWAPVPVSFANQTSGVYQTAVNGAADTYNQLGGGTLINTTSPGSTRLTVSAANYGNIGVDGAMVKINTAFAEPQCNKGLWTGGDGQIVVNTFYGDAYDPLRLQSVYAHEIGHSAGLSHNNDTAPCFGGYRAAISIMNEATSIRASGLCAIAGPQADDKNGLRSIYAAGK